MCRCVWRDFCSRTHCTHVRTFTNCCTPATVRGAQAQDVRTVHGTASSTGIGQSIEFAECGCDAGNCVAERIEKMNAISILEMESSMICPGAICYIVRPISTRRNFYP
jgi:hypothetical protein